MTDRRDVQPIRSEPVIDWAQMCACGHTRGEHWYRGMEVGSVECGGDDCQCVLFELADRR